MSAPRDVVFTFSYVSWAGAQGRGMNMCQDRLASRLLDDPKVRRLVIANPYRSLPRYLARRALRRPEGEQPGGRAVLHEPLRLRREDPTSLRAIERMYRRYDAELERVAERAGMEDPSIVTMHPLIGGFAELDWARKATFYCTDDWSAAPAYRAWWPAYREGYQRIRDRGRPVIAVSQPILDRLRPTGDACLVANGVDGGEWRAPSSPPAWFAALPRPRMLYLGTLDARLDVAAVRATAQAYPQGSIALVGTLSDAAHISRLEGLPNVHVHRRAPRHEVPGLVMGADVCLIPHERTAFTEAMSPLKAYEYLAGGRPVTATDLPPIGGLGPRVELVAPGGDFVAGVARSLHAGPADEGDRLAFVEANTWATRHGQVLDLVLG